MDMATAASSQGFSQGGIRSSDWFSETLLRAHGALTSDRDVGRPRSGPPPSAGRSWSEFERCPLKSGVLLGVQPEAVCGYCPLSPQGPVLGLRPPFSDPQT